MSNTPGLSANANAQLGLLDRIQNSPLRNSHLDEQGNYKYYNWGTSQPPASVTTTTGTSGTSETSLYKETPRRDEFMDKLQELSRTASDLFRSECCCPSEPNPGDSSHPGGLQVDSKGVISTPGGYKIEQLGQFEWKVTGPDGKHTRVWGDPHVDEGDGGKWDFKRDSTFVLGDGTRINVSTKPWGNGSMTVTGQLEVISGNDRVVVKDIDKGKGKVGEVTKDGFQHVNSFGNKDTFVMGQETDDWSFTGKEIVGDNNGGESFKLGKDLPVKEVKPLVDHASTQEAKGKFFEQLFNKIAEMYRAATEGLLSKNDGKMPDVKWDFPQLDGANRGCWSRHGQQNEGLEKLRKLFDAVGTMFQALRQVVESTSWLRSPTSRPV